MKGLKLAVASLALAGLAGWLEPRLLASPAEVLGSLARQVALERELAEVPGTRGAVAALARAPDGALWVASRQQITRFPGGALDGGEAVLSPEIHRRRFGASMDPLAALHVAGAAEAWAGTWYGQVLRYRDGLWQRVAAIQALGAEHYVGAQ
ncbi:MAG: hypothetical protein R3286_10840, partial [Gammaproteobacteria bacterium]|nr:hypothetical protein [Gammaproteobacteria bacterium]